MNIIAEILKNPTRLAALKIAFILTLVLGIATSCMVNGGKSHTPPGSQPTTTTAAELPDDNPKVCARDFAEAYAVGNLQGAAALASPRVAEDLREAPVTEQSLQILDGPMLMKGGPTQQTYLVTTSKNRMLITVATDGRKWLVDDVEIKR